MAIVILWELALFPQGVNPSPKVIQPESILPISPARTRLLVFPQEWIGDKVPSVCVTVWSLVVCAVRGRYGYISYHILYDWISPEMYDVWGASESQTTFLTYA